MADHPPGGDGKRYGVIGPNPRCSKLRILSDPLACVFQACVLPVGKRQLKAQGMALQAEADESTTGPASFVAVDPDGNPILVDRHV